MGNGSAEAFLKHVMSAMSYIAKKGYIKEYEAAKKTAGLAVFKCKVREDLWIAADVPPAGTVSPELEAFQEAKSKVRNKTADRDPCLRKGAVLPECQCANGDN